MRSFCVSVRTYMSVRCKYMSYCIVYYLSDDKRVCKTMHCSQIAQPFVYWREKMRCLEFESSGFTYILNQITVKHNAFVS